MNSSLNHVLHVPIAVEAELDRRMLTLRSILELEVGSIVPLTRSAGENIDLLAGSTTLASGEIVVIDERVGVRITDLAGEPT